MPVGEWTRVVELSECRPGRGRYVAIGTHELAVFRLESDPDQVIVTKNSCPHAGGNLAAGALAGTVVTCPWHQWPFDLVSGKCTLSENVNLARFESRVEDGWVWVRLPK